MMQQRLQTKLQGVTIQKKTIDSLNIIRTSESLLDRCQPLTNGGLTLPLYVQIYWLLLCMFHDILLANPYHRSISIEAV
jgi:hypothetical protein